MYPSSPLLLCSTMSTIGQFAATKLYSRDGADRSHLLVDSADAIESELVPEGRLVAETLQRLKHVEKQRRNAQASLESVHAATCSRPNVLVVCVKGGCRGSMNP